MGILSSFNAGIVFANVINTVAYIVTISVSLLVNEIGLPSLSLSIVWVTRLLADEPYAIPTSVIVSPTYSSGFKTIFLFQLETGKALIISSVTADFVPKRLNKLVLSDVGVPVPSPKWIYPKYEEPPHNLVHIWLRIMLYPTNSRCSPVSMLSMCTSNLL